MLLECYQQAYKDGEGKYQVNENSNVKTMRRITEQEFREILFMYKQALQDFVVSGVKHNELGSAGFEVFFLNNMIKPENAEAIHKTLSQVMNRDPKLIIKMLSVITWAEEMNVLTACNAFLRLYNKGQEPDEDTMKVLLKLEHFIQSSTFFGKLLKTVYDIRAKAENKKVSTIDFQQLFEDNANEVKTQANTNSGDVMSLFASFSN